MAPSTRLVFLARTAFEITPPKLWPSSTTLLVFGPKFPDRILSNELFEDGFLNIHLVDIARDSVKGMLLRLKVCEAESATDTEGFASPSLS